MERDNLSPGAQPITGTGTTGHDLGVGPTGTGIGHDGSTSDSLAEKGQDLAARGRDKAEDMLESGRNKAEDMLDDGRDRAAHAADRGKARLADGISRIGERLDEQAGRLEERGGLGERAGRYLHSASDVAEDSAEYLRTHELDVIRDDFADQVRARPLLSCGIALGAGFLLGSAGSSSSRDRHDRDWDDDRAYRARAHYDDHDEDSDESGLRAQLGRAVVSGITTLLTREIQQRVSGRNR
jgi:ElaB/YqjD/DUF883 family membrane-anchored ribosome-binding protein